MTINKDANDNYDSYRGYTIYAQASDGTYWVSGVERWMTVEQIDDMARERDIAAQQEGDE